MDDSTVTLVVSARDRRDQIEGRTEIRASCEILFGQPDFDPDSGQGQILKAVLDYLDGEERVGL